MIHATHTGYWKKNGKNKDFFVMKADMMAFFDETANKQ